MRPVTALLTSWLALTEQATSVVLPVYRDLLKPAPFLDATYYDRCGAGSGPVQILRADTPKDVAAAIVRDLDAGNVLQLAERSLARASRELPGATVTVCLFPGELAGGLPYLDGVGGVSLGNGRIKLLLHPKPGGLRRVTYTVAHEYHHEVERLLGPGGFDPIDIIVREGKADYFATGLYPELRPPHTRPLSVPERRQSWAALLEYQHRRAPPSEFRGDFMIGKNPRVLPWPGYRLGFEMVELYFRGRQLAPDAVLKTPARDIVEHYRRHQR